MRFTTLQIGRFVAALVVLVLHTIHYARADLGLDLPPNSPFLTYVLGTAVVYFFVLSGFVVTHSAQRSSALRIIVVRLLRFYPAFWMAVGAVCLGRWWAGALFDVPAKYYWRGLTLWPYGEGRAVYPLGVEWTLVYEVFLLAGLVPMMLVHRRWGIGVGSAVWLAVVVAKELLDPIATIPVLPRLREWPLAVPNAPFLMGALACLTYRRWASPGLGLPIAAATAYFLGAAYYPAVPGVSFLFQSLGVALLTAWLAVVRQPAADSGLVVAGDWTYGIYLIHVSVLIAFYSWASDSQHFPPSAATMLLGAALALAVGSLYGFLEYRAFLRVRAWMTEWKPPAWLPRRCPGRHAALAERLPEPAP